MMYRSLFKSSIWVVRSDMSCLTVFSAPSDAPLPIGLSSCSVSSASALPPDTFCDLASSAHGCNALTWGIGYGYGNGNGSSNGSGMTNCSGDSGGQHDDDDDDEYEYEYEYSR
eukprot:763971-Hanusia_phi.AAC.1